MVHMPVLSDRPRIQPARVPLDAFHLEHAPFAMGFANAWTC